MQIPILNGIYTDENAEFRAAYPVNLIPVPKKQGISEGYLRPADGIVQNGTGPGVTRGAINWNGVLYRVMGSKLVSIAANGTITELGTIAGTDNVTFDYSFDRLGVSGGGQLYYWDGSTLFHVIDPDLGTVVDFIWVDGYFMSTDGTNLIVTELNDPTSVNPLKYGSSEVAPDPVLAILKLHDEPHALNRYTIEVFTNIGGSLFPFQRVPGALIEKGVIGTHACCIYLGTIAFLGSGRDESPSIYMGVNGSATKISTREIDTILATFTELELSAVKLEERNDQSNQFLYAHLPDRTLVYDAVASASTGEHVWFTLTTSVVNFSQYLARDMAWCYDRWNVGHPQSAAVGYFSHSLSSHWAAKIRWEFATAIIYNSGNGAIINELELVALTGRVNLAANPMIATSYSLDGETWSQDRVISAGKQGDRSKRLSWIRQGSMSHWRVQRFRGDSDAFMSFARLEAQLEPLAR